MNAHNPVNILNAVINGQDELIEEWNVSPTTIVSLYREGNEGQLSTL